MKNEPIKFQGSKISNLETFGKLPESLQMLLQQTNGFIAFDGGLHIRGIVNFPDWHSLEKVWFGDFALYKLFPNLKSSDVPFGQDCFGDQFVLRNETIWQLMAETGDLENLHLSLGEFLTRVEESPIEFLLLQPLQRFKDEGGKFENGQLLNVYPPFCTEEAKEGVSLQAIPMFERISFLADFAKQINDL
jgi:hypothetical protein